MHDIKWISENPGLFDTALCNRNLSPKADEILKIDQEKRAVTSKLQQMQSRRNEIASLIASAKQKQQDTSELEKESSDIKLSISQSEETASKLDAQLNDILSTLPNIPLADVPVGKDETANVCIRRVGEPRVFSFQPKRHYELGENLGLIDFAAAAKISGSRFTILKGAIARMERALKDFMLDSHREFGYEEISVPFLVKPESMFGTGQLPKFKEDSFCTTDNKWLIPTAEVPLTNLVREEVVPVEKLPMRVTAYSACFRSEAGSAGRDTRGMIRNHQFSKVELVSIVHPDQGEVELERMTDVAETILQKLELPYRVMLLSTGDMGFSARKTYDLEVWLPGEDTYREISSCSLCGQFQARRMGARYKGKDSKGYVSTLNGSGLAIGRTIVAILENYQQEDGSIKIPKALVPYMGGIEEIKSHG
ncbi:MAG: serine--tRNA ligase [Alphaproteobacteria bacterium]|nr:serine--tRNA ligase [Alphaproteobacteria bacterium]